MSQEISHRLAQAVALAERNVAQGGGPFGAVLVTAGGRVFEGVNRVTDDNDPTAHAEVTAIRRACRELGTFALEGAVLYASCEPCPMCLAASLWARIARVYFAADRFDAARAGFDDAAFYRYFEAGTRELMPVEQVEAPAAVAPFERWAQRTDRIEY